MKGSFMIFTMKAAEVPKSAMRVVAYLCIHDGNCPAEVSGGQ